METGPQFDRRLDAIFQAEAREHVQRMLASLAELEGGAAGAQAERAIELLFRATHSLKGAARAVGRDEMETLCHAMENLLAGVQRGRLAWAPAMGEVLHDAATALGRALAGEGSAAELAALLPALETVASGAQPAAPRAAAASIAAPAAEVSDGTVRIAVERLGSLLYEVEELVAFKLGRQQLMQDFDAVLASGDALRAATPPAGAAAARAHAEHERRLRALRAAAEREHRQLGAAVDTLLARIKTALLVPVASLGPFVLATVRELSRSQGKEVELRLVGGEVEMDRRLLEELREPLVHLLRNAIFHGIEGPRERAARGKPARARIELAIQPRPGGRVLIQMADDGDGIDTARLAQAARELELPVPEPASEAQLLPLVFSRGLSTAAGVSHVAGRGIGLAIVRETVERLGGSIAVDSARGQGTRFTLLLPLSLATFRAVEVQAAGRSFLLPTAQVERCMRFGADQVHAMGRQLTVTLHDQQLPLAGLAALLDLPQPAVPARLDCLVLRAGERRIALVVDQVLGEQEVLSKPVERGLTASPLVAGAAALGAGRVVPILNGAELVRAALREGGRGAMPPLAVAAETGTRSVLLAEDSITSRTLLKNILEVAGYRVEVAADGLQALEKLRGAAFDAVVSDIEMPNLDGIGLTEAIRADPQLAHLPVVLVTSLGSPADRERGAEAGANAYIVKSSFEQGDLLQALQELA